MQILLPIAEEVELSRGFNRDPLEEISLGSSANKEFLIDLQRVLNINALDSNEHLGDKTYLWYSTIAARSKIKVRQGF